MNYFKGKTINEAYSLALNTLLTEGNEVANTIELNNVALEIVKPSLNDLHFEGRKLSEKYAINELKWYWSGDNSCQTIGQYAKKWLDISDDGLTSNSAYGYILFNKYQKNQLEEVIRTLALDVNSRRAVLNISDPTIDRIHTKDMQCTIAIQFLLRNNKLNMTVFMRSNDMRYGLPYDYIFFESIQQYVRYKLHADVGTYTHFATSMHIYKSDLDKFKEHSQKLTIDWLSIIKSYYLKESYFLRETEQFKII